MSVYDTSHSLFGRKRITGYIYFKAFISVIFLYSGGGKIKHVKRSIDDGKFFFEQFCNVIKTYALSNDSGKFLDLFLFLCYVKVKMTWCSGADYLIGILLDYGLEHPNFMGGRGGEGNL